MKIFLFLLIPVSLLFFLYKVLNLNRETLEKYRTETPISILVISFTLFIAWITAAFGTYLKGPPEHAIVPLFLAPFFILWGRISAPRNEMPYLFGWNDPPLARWVRASIYAAVFVGPATYQLTYPFFDSGSTEQKYTVVVACALMLGAYPAWQKALHDSSLKARAEYASRKQNPVKITFRNPKKLPLIGIPRPVGLIEVKYGVFFFFDHSGIEHELNYNEVESIDYIAPQQETV